MRIDTEEIVNYDTPSTTDEAETQEYKQAVDILSDDIANRKKERKAIVVEIPRSKNKDINSLIEKNNKDYEDRIVTELEKNKIEKRSGRKMLLKLLKLFLFVQFSICFILIAGAFLMIGLAHFQNQSFEPAVISNILNFLKFYIGSVVVELISMLYFIVKNTFDTTISDLAKKVAENLKNESNNL